MADQISKTIVQITILHPSDDLMGGVLNLNVLAEQIDDGDWLGSVEILSTAAVPPDQIRTECCAIGNDGTFFELDDALTDPMCTCDNCGARNRKSDLNEIQDLEERLDYPPEHPSCIMPSGECPECFGALCYADEGLDSVQNSDLMEAAGMDDLNAACLRLQQQAGIEAGDVAGVFFSGPKGEGWPNYKLNRRYTLLQEYMQAERAMAEGA